MTYNNINIITKVIIQKYNIIIITTKRDLTTTKTQFRREVCVGDLAEKCWLW